MRTHIRRHAGVQIRRRGHTHMPVLRVLPHRTWGGQCNQNTGPRTRARSTQRLYTRRHAGAQIRRHAGLSTARSISSSLRSVTLFSACQRTLPTCDQLTAHADEGHSWRPSSAVLSGGKGSVRRFFSAGVSCNCGGVRFLFSWLIANCCSFP